MNHAGDGIPVASGRIFALGDCAKVLGTEMRFTKEGRVRKTDGIFMGSEKKQRGKSTIKMEFNGGL